MAEYIDREALIKYAEKQEVIIVKGTSIADAMRIQGNVFRRCVETCPPADVEKVRHGEWVFEHETYGKMICSLCKEEALLNECNEYVDSIYCPNCGAKMDGKGD